MAIAQIKTKSTDKTGSLAGELIIWAIGLYKRLVSPLLPHSCRFYPTCSQYCIEAVEKHGPTKGIFVGFMRIIRCNQFFKGGVDPLR